MLFMRVQLFLLLVLSFIGCTANSVEIDVSRHEFSLGDAVVTVVVHEGNTDGLTFVNLHENERTSIEAAIDHIRQAGGRFIHLEHTGDRNISFSVNGTPFVVDPNRIFTDVGIRATLENLSSFSDAAARKVIEFRDELLRIINIESLPVVVAVHNNTNDQYSILSYTEGGIYESDASHVRVNPDQDIDDFFFITETSWYEPIGAAGYNVAVQHPSSVTDDGSLSVYCGRHGIPYVNVEAEHGHLEEQLEMLDFLDGFLRDRIPVEREMSNY